MYLEKLEIQGFKSFANKNTLIFPGMISKDKRGITCIVGPNGSGKSNIADAIRWVLGEQSMKTLRGKKSEDIIFSGSDKKGRLGMSEVSLFLNNEDRRADIDYSQVILTRRLYRDGASEYLINNNRVRLSDVQMLLAKSKFGQKTYSVIGQGMVEGFLNTSLAERKEFFDEATGVKQFQIKRDDSLNKLRQSYENLAQVEMLLSEIEPRLKSLTRQINKLQKRETLENELKELQLKYYGKIWHEINNKFKEFNKNYLKIEKIKIEKDKKLIVLNERLSQMESSDRAGQEFNEWQIELSELQSKKDNINQQIAKVEASLEIQLETKGHFDLSWLNSKKGEIKKEIEKIENETKELANIINNEEGKKKTLVNEQSEINNRIQDLNNKINNLGSSTDNDKTKKISTSIKNLLASLEGAEQESDEGKIKNIIKEVKAELQKMLELSENGEEKENIEIIQKNLIEVGEEKSKVSEKINVINFIISAKSERSRLLNERQGQLSQELGNINNKLKQNQNKFDVGEIEGKKEELNKELKKIEEKIKEIKDKINSFSQKEEEKRSQLFELQKNTQSLQNEINQLNNQINEVKINSTRYETKLEDLETEIREEYGSLKEIKEFNKEEGIDKENAKEQIHNLKKQLNMIGSIDPETEKEYTETKERFDFLSEQVDDLINAIGSLEKIIKELDIVIKERFDKEFKLIAQKFEEYFKILFNGGRAKIIKVLASEEEMENKEEGVEKDGSKEMVSVTNLKRIKFLQKHNATGLAGVEIQATPPGKKIQTVTMLSGGERALTAIALICAIISANPSPFVVLDEVDASLDEANSERLAKILEDLSHKTQFIIITHNRASMRKANILYGITMLDDGVSKLLSIKLDEAEKKIKN